MIADVGGVPPGLRLYLFGSARHEARPRDLDLLVIYETGTASVARAFVRELARIGLGGWGDFTIISQGEAGASGFLGRVDALEVGGATTS